jgi:hypothetical protein
MENKSSVVLGAVLVLIGIGLLLSKMNVIDFSWYEIYPLGLLGLSALSFASLTRGNKNGVFMGTAFAVIGLFFFCRNFGLLDFLWNFKFWPIVLISLGLGFIALFIVKPYDWGVLIPGSILTFLGAIFLLDSMDFAWRQLRLARRMWPLILVLVGVGLIISTLSKRRE